MAAFVGLNPSTDITWVDSPDREAFQLFAEGRVDALMATPPRAQEARARQLGHVVVSTVMDRPWSQYFCCLMAGHRDFVRRYPVATKQLRAILKATDICAREPERVARFLVDEGYAERYDYTLAGVAGDSVQSLARVRSGGYGAIPRPPAARSWDDQDQSPEDHRAGDRLALPQRTEEGAEGLAGACLWSRTGAPISPTDAVTDVRGSRAGEQVGETESLPFSTPNHRLQPTPYSVRRRARLQAQRLCAAAKLGASCRAQVLAEEGLTSHLTAGAPVEAVQTE